MERPTPDPPKPGQESVWAYPRPAIAVPTTAHVVVSLAGGLVAETRAAIRTLETSLPPTYYLPLADIAAGALRPVAGETFCEWKGVARYFDVEAGGETRRRAAWTYPEPTAAFASIGGHIAFYPGLVDCLVDGERARPQASGFYGGWITSHVAGPFKGPPGTDRW